jgi:hypothetical protein
MRGPRRTTKSISFIEQLDSLFEHVSVLSYDPLIAAILLPKVAGLFVPRAQTS